MQISGINDSCQCLLHRSTLCEGKKATKGCGSVGLGNTALDAPKTHASQMSLASGTSASHDPSPDKSVIQRYTTAFFKLLLLQSLFNFHNVWGPRLASDDAHDGGFGDGDKEVVQAHCAEQTVRPCQAGIPLCSKYSRHPISLFVAERCEFTSIQWLLNRDSIYSAGFDRLQTRSHPRKSRIEKRVSRAWMVKGVRCMKGRRSMR